jgi:hypothetical protein
LLLVLLLVLLEQGPRQLLRQRLQGQLLLHVDPALRWRWHLLLRRHRRRGRGRGELLLLLLLGGKEEVEHGPELCVGLAGGGEEARLGAGQGIVARLCD